MIVESVINLLVAAVKALFGWIQLPAFPAGLASALTSFFDLIFDNLSMLGLFVNVGTLKIAVPCYLVISNFDKVYHMLMFVLKKLPFGIKD